MSSPWWLPWLSALIVVLAVALPAVALVMLAGRAYARWRERSGVDARSPAARADAEAVAALNRGEPAGDHDDQDADDDDQDDGAGWWDGPPAGLGTPPRGWGDEPAPAWWLDPGDPWVTPHASTPGAGAERDAERPAGRGRPIGPGPSRWHVCAVVAGRSGCVCGRRVRRRIARAGR